jgi:hypothetical protein
MSRDWSANVPNLSKSTNSADAVATSALTMVTSNSFSAASSTVAVCNRRARQTPLEFVHGRRCQEDQQRIWHLFAHLAGALKIDLEKNRPSRRQMLVDVRSPGAISGGAVDDRPFQQVAVLDQSIEGRIVDEVVVDTVDLTGTRGAGRH